MFPRPPGACGARPFAGEASPLRMAYRGRPGDHVKGGFLGGAHSVRPLDTAPTNAKALHYGQGVGRIAGGLLVTCLASARALLTGVRSPPLRGGTSPAWMAVRGKVGDDAEGGFSRRDALCASALRGRAHTEA